MPNIIKSQLSIVFVALSLLTACGERPPPDHRAPVTLPLYTQGDADRGALIYEDACGQCHQLNPGSNKKGPQLMNIYGAPAADLADYNYSEGLAKSGWVWDAEKLDPYIADAEKALADSKMLADPMPDASERADVIAYLSTLRAAAPVIDSDGNQVNSKATADDTSTDGKINTKRTQMSNERIEISTDPSQKPAADFQ